MLNKEKLKVQFLKIAPKVTEPIKLQACLDNGCSYITLARYLRGSVGKEPFGNKLLKYLKEKVA